jgi:hypothetical protein
VPRSHKGQPDGGDVGRGAGEGGHSGLRRQRPQSEDRERRNSVLSNTSMRDGSVVSMEGGEVRSHVFLAVDQVELWEIYYTCLSLLLLLLEKLRMHVG